MALVQPSATEGKTTLFNTDGLHMGTFYLTNEHDKVNFRVSGEVEKLNLSIRYPEYEWGLYLCSSRRPQPPPDEVHNRLLQSSYHWMSTGTNPCGGSSRNTTYTINNLTASLLVDAIFSEYETALPYIGGGRKLVSQTSFLTKFGLLERVGILPHGSVTWHGVAIHNGRFVFLISGDIVGGRTSCSDHRIFSTSESNEIRKIISSTTSNMHSDMQGVIDEVHEDVQSLIRRFGTNYTEQLQMARAQNESLMTEVNSLRAEVRRLSGLYQKLVDLALEDSKRTLSTPIGNPFDDFKTDPF